MTEGREVGNMKLHLITAPPIISIPELDPGTCSRFRVQVSFQDVSCSGICRAFLSLKLDLEGYPIGTFGSDRLI
jgi:hypothetical protein